MIWRSPFVSVIVEQPDFPPLALRADLAADLEFPSVWLLVTSDPRVAQLQIWIKLLSQDWPIRIPIYFGATAAVLPQLALMLPGSTIGKFKILPDKWSSVKELQAQEAVVLYESSIQPTMMIAGAPTEDAWEEFQFRAKSLES